MTNNGESESTVVDAELIGRMIFVHGVRHRVVAMVGDEVLLLDVQSHHPYLVQQQPDHPLRLPTAKLISDMLLAGSAKPAAPEIADEPSAFEKMRVQLEMLDAAGVKQGDKAIWIHMARSWTPELVERFGPHDDPATLRRWRAELRKSRP